LSCRSNKHGNHGRWRHAGGLRSYHKKINLSVGLYVSGPERIEWSALADDFRTFDFNGDLTQRNGS
jgi:hypothetical protein